MEERLRPVNALLGLLTRGDENPAALADAGFRLVGLEVPVAGPQGTVTVDAVLLHDESLHLLLCEVKSGANVDQGQAQRYAALDAGAVVQAGHVTLPRRGTLTVATAYVCLAQHADRIRLGMDTAGVRYPLLAVHEAMITLLDEGAASSQLRVAFGSGPIRLIRPPPRLVAFDHDSPVDVIQPFVKAELVAGLANRAGQLTVGGLTERITPYFGLYGRKARQRLIQRVGEAARRVAAADPDTFAYEAPAANRDGLLRLLRTPESNDPRGRTQAYQALVRGGHTRRRRPVPVDPNQLDLLQELDEAEDVSDEEENRSPGEEEETP